MKINPIVNNYQTPQKQQSFGATRHKYFNKVLSGMLLNICKRYTNGSDMLSALATQQAKLVEMGEDFTSKIDRLVITTSTGEIVHPELILKNDYGGPELDTYLKFGKKMIYNKNQLSSLTPEGTPQDKILPNFLDNLFLHFQTFLAKTDEAMERSLTQVQNTMRMLPPPKSLEEEVLPKFATLSELPEKHAKETIKKLMGLGITTKEDLLEIAGSIGCLPPSLSHLENLEILKEIEKLSPSLSDEQIRELLDKLGKENTTFQSRSL